MKKIMLNQNNVQGITLTLDEAFDRFEKYSKAKGLVKDTIDSYYKYYCYFCDFLEIYQERTNIPITKCNQVTEDIMFEYIAYMKDKDSINDVSINTRITHIKVFFTFCFERSYMAYFKIRKLRIQKTIKELYTDKEMDLLLTKPDTTECGFVYYRNWVAANFFYATMLRLGSIVEIKIKDILFLTKQIFISHLKNKNTVFLPLGDELENILREYLSYRERRTRRLSVL